MNHCLHNTKYKLQGICNRPLIGNGRHGGLMVSALDSGSGGPEFELWSGHCVVFLGKA